jgi:hypothetical protein
MSVIAAKSSAKVVPFEFRFLSFGSDAKYLGNMLSQISQWICSHLSYNDGLSTTHMCYVDSHQRDNYKNKCVPPRKN